MDKIQSADGTAIAYERFGDGPPVILIGGAFNDRSTTTALAQALGTRLTAYVYDRRGRGDSDDTPPPAVEREMEDLDAVIGAAGGAASVFGHSSGAVLALEAAARGMRIERLAVYEPSYIVDDSRPRPAADLADQLRNLVAEGRRGDAVALFLTECAGLPAEAVTGMRGAPFWAGMEALAHTLPYDVSLHGPRQSLPTARIAEIRVPTLVLQGSATDAYLATAAQAVAATIRAAEHLTLDGEDHGVLQHPDALVTPLTDFFTRGTR